MFYDAMLGLEVQQEALDSKSILTGKSHAPRSIGSSALLVHLVPTLISAMLPVTWCFARTRVNSKAKRLHVGVSW
jgi:hypothetical protein